MEEIIFYIANVFKVLQSCDARKFPGKFHVTLHWSSAMSSCHKAVMLVRPSSQRSKHHLKVHAAQIGLHNYIIFRNKTLTNSNKLLHILTLRHNTSRSYVHVYD